MKIEIFDNKEELGAAAGRYVAELLRGIISEKGFANIILATGTSQFDTIDQLIKENDIDWSVVTMFHLDEYIGLPISHPASFRKYLQERFLAQVPALKEAHLINGENEANIEVARVSQLITNCPVDIALVGVGENGHLAFNDPPADFETEEPYLIVDLDDACRHQQMGEGWFQAFDEVPKQAISMSIRQIMKSDHIICSVPDARKATAVKNSLENEVSNIFPASILQQHNNCTFFLDKHSADLLSEKSRSIGQD
ncbi:glucosamine-6-phosphate deaminase [Dyadobacter sp. CY343]|uniref:glucosamine-6-phosphate deaminase n=1 Tax=Dyadobacter sp. CY343 TaxID=2907299 RepID=UPI001F2AF0CC|nr:glucosamine-6-phosphate deaminase [Dyadobacter sp. CY343]MCE7058438.1 glucosamine-6-phosphate deaminase [Dyadobacter sp. CY343]